MLFFSTTANTRICGAFLLYFIWGGTNIYSQQSDVFLNIDQDAVLYEISDGSLANSKGEYLFVGKDSEGDIKRSLLRVDLGDEIPLEATIDSAFLFISLNKTRNDEQPIYSYQILKRWMEGSSNASANEGKGTSVTTGDPTWLHRVYPDTLWDQEGGDFGEDLLFQGTVDGTGTYSFKATSAFLELMTQWLRNETPNYGFILLGNEDVENGSSKRFTSHQFSGTANRPQLSVYFSTNSSSSDELSVELPKQHTLQPNFPNPFNPTTTLSFVLAKSEQVELIIYNQLGIQVRLLLADYLSAGSHQITFDASNLPSGLYYYQLKTTSGSFTRSMTLIK
jgi:hypothetical protein